MSKFRCFIIVRSFSGAKKITVLLHGVGVGLVVQYLLDKSVTGLKANSLRTATTVVMPNTMSANDIFQYRRCFSPDSFSCPYSVRFLVNGTVNMLLELFGCRFYFVAMCILLASFGLFDGDRLSDKDLC